MWPHWSADCQPVQDEKKLEKYLTGSNSRYTIATHYQRNQRPLLYSTLMSIFFFKTHTKIQAPVSIPQSPVQSSGLYLVALLYYFTQSNKLLMQQQCYHIYGDSDGLTIHDMINPIYGITFDRYYFILFIFYRYV